MLKAVQLARPVALGILSLPGLAMGWSHPAQQSLRATSPVQQAPNVLIVLADDLGYADIGAFGSQAIATPRIDQLCASGVKLNSFYAHSTCTPSRGALLTGRYAPRFGLGGPIGSWSPRGLSPDEVTLAEVLKAKGYVTGLFGKWHLGDSPDQQPTAQGFDEFSGLLWGPTGLPLVFKDGVHDSLEYEPDQRLDTFRATTRTVDFIRRASGTGAPFLCITSYVTPHDPATASAAFQGSSADGRDYGDAVEEMDASIGVIVDEIANLGLREDTIVIFMSDNGATFGRNPYQDGNNGVFRRGKGSTWEGGPRVPACVYWPGRLAPGLELDNPMSITDLLPTLAGIAGASLDPAIKLDGYDILPVLEGAAPDPNRAVHLPRLTTFEAVRRGRYKYRLGALYDLETDPGEQTDVSASFPAITQSLAQELADITADVQANGRPAAASTRILSRWRGEFGLLPVGSALVNGNRWASITDDARSLEVIDGDPNQDMLVTDASALGTATTPAMAIRVGSYSANLSLRRTGAELSDDAPFTLSLWYRAIAPGRSEDIVLLDIGDSTTGLSMTLGDGGVMGDDVAPGQRDDLLLRIGGSSQPNSATLLVDLPGNLSTSFHHLLATRDEAGDLILYFDGFELGRIQASGVAWGARSTWSLFAPDGATGGAGGAGVRPFVASRSRGEIGGFGLWDRSLRRNEAEAQYSRYYQLAYCHGRPNVTGRTADLLMQGSFQPSDNKLFARVKGLPPLTFGFLLASLDQERTDVSNGTLCIGGQLLRFSRQVSQADSAGESFSQFDLTNVPIPFTLSTEPTWNFQYWYRDGAAANFSNGLIVYFPL